MHLERAHENYINISDLEAYFKLNYSISKPDQQNTKSTFWNLFLEEVSDTKVWSELSVNLNFCIIYLKEKKTNKKNLYVIVNCMTNVIGYFC